MIVYKFKNYYLYLGKRGEEKKLEGFRTLCGDEWIEIVGEGFFPCEKEWAFCHLKKLLPLYEIVMEKI